MFALAVVVVIAAGMFERACQSLVLSRNERYSTNILHINSLQIRLRLTHAVPLTGIGSSDREGFSPSTPALTQN